MRKFLILFLWFSVMLLAVNLRADDGVTVTGEKGLFTILTADTLPDGKFSFGVNHNNVDRDMDDIDIAYYSVTLGYGVTEDLEVVAMVTPYAGFDIDPKFYDGGKHGLAYVNGFGDIQVGAKYALMRSENGGVGVRGFVKIPTADDEEGVGTGKVDIGFDVVASGMVGNTLEVAANVGVTFRGDPDGFEAGTPVRYGVGAAFPASSAIQGVVELTGELVGDEALYEDSTDLTGGLRWRICDNWFVSAGARWNVQAERELSQYPYGGVVSLSYAPGRAKEGAVVPPPPPTPPPPPPVTPPPPPPPPPVPIEFVWPEVYFPFDQYILTAETRQKLDTVATEMTDHPDMKVTIEGHCCYIGTDEYNLALGQHRADSVKDYLVGKGISADRLGTVSYGESKPKYENDKEITRRFNRRGFFIVLKPE